MKHILLLIFTITMPVLAAPKPESIPKIKQVLASLKPGAIRQDELVRLVRVHFPDAHIIPSVGDLANRGFTLKMHKDKNTDSDLMMTVTDGRFDWQHRNEKFTLRDIVVHSKGGGDSHMAWYRFLEGEWVTMPKIR
ncbi:hypothetical protein [Oceaniferula spumae]